jgi:hypothetical protein
LEASGKGKRREATGTALQLRVSVKPPAAATAQSLSSGQPATALTPDPVKSYATTGQAVVAGVPSTTLIGMPQYVDACAGSSLVPQSACIRTEAPTAPIHAMLFACAGKRTTSSMRVLKTAVGGNIAQSPIAGDVPGAGAGGEGAGAGAGAGPGACATSTPALPPPQLASAISAAALNSRPMSSRFFRP